jgi:hypothetical protein
VPVVRKDAESAPVVRKDAESALIPIENGFNIIIIYPGSLKMKQVDILQKG